VVPLPPAPATAPPAAHSPILDGVFPGDAVIRRVNREAILLAGGGRALLMQLAHPLVARGVHEHSNFEADPYPRLWRTLEATYTVVFGTDAQARAVARHLERLHDRVTGPGYRANDPELLLWVHATLIDTSLEIYERVYGPLPLDEAARYYDDSTCMAELLGVPRAMQPPDLAGFRRYVADTVAALEVTPTALALSRSILHPPLPRLAYPVAALQRLVTTGLLPSTLRGQYRLPWSPMRAAAFGASVAATRAVYPRLPAGLRGAPAWFMVAPWWSAGRAP